ncbi:hypothetical protein J4E91_007750 [Alternaria rosae]|nr:hypothetical protein J4E91_007750 [Alternaria rosae]
MSFSSGNPLNKSLSRYDIGSLYNYTSRVIPELALLGYTDVAGRLLGSLNNHDFYHDRFGSLRSLWFLWNLRAREDGVPWPEGEEEKVRQAVRERRAKTKGDDTRTEDDETIKPDDVQEELKLIAKDFLTKWYYPIGMPDSDRAVAFNTHKLDRPPTTAQMLDCIRNIIQSFEIAHPVAKIRDVRSGLHPRDATLPHSLGQQSYETQPAMESWQAWKLYKRGALRQQLNIDEAALANFAQDFEHTVTERLANGRSKPRSNLSVQELLKAVEYNTQTNPKARQYSNANEQPHETSLINAPATESQIEEAEARLNITLPSDYKAFLRFSNGFGSAWGHPLGDFQTPLHSVDKLRWLDPTEEDYFTDLSLDLPTRWDKWPFAPPPTAKAYACDDVSEHFLIGRALEIGTQEIDNTWLLPPSTIMPIKQAVKKMLDDGSLGEREKNSVRAAIRDYAGSEEEWEEMEWACVTWASGGVAAMYVYPGFRAWLEDVVEKGKVGLDGEEGLEYENMLKRGMWLGRVFENKRSEDELDADGDGEELPGWLKDAIRAARPTKRY